MSISPSQKAVWIGQRSGDSCDRAEGITRIAPRAAGQVRADDRPVHTAIDRSIYLVPGIVESGRISRIELDRGQPIATGGYRPAKVIERIATVG